MTVSRLSDDALGLALARDAADAADCTRRSVGAVTFDRDGHVVGVGANRGPDGEPGCTQGACPRGRRTREEHPGYDGGNHDYSDCISTHAEVQAGASEGGTMFVTHRPCNNCLDFIRSSGLTRVVWPEGEWVPRRMFALRLDNDKVIEDPVWTCPSDVLSAYHGFGVNRVYGTLIFREDDLQDWRDYTFADLINDKKEA